MLFDIVSFQNINTASDFFSILRGRGGWGGGGRMGVGGWGRGLGVVVLEFHVILYTIATVAPLENYHSLLLCFPSIERPEHVLVVITAHIYVCTKYHTKYQTIIENTSERLVIHTIHMLHAESSLGEIRLKMIFYV